MGGEKDEPYPILADTAQIAPCSTRNYISLSQAYHDCTDIAYDLDTLLNQQPAKLLLGIGSLDQSLNGGLQDEFLIIYGLAGRGKTDFLVTALSALAENRLVLVASYELGRFQIIRRLLCCISARIDAIFALSENELFRNSELDTLKQELLSMTKQEFEKIASNIIILDGFYKDGSALMPHSIQELRKAVNVISEQEKQAPVLLVDYIQAIPVDNVSLLSTEAIDLTSRNLAAIAHTEGATVIAASSVAKNSEVRGSSHLLHDADIILKLELDCLRGDECNALKQDVRSLLFTVEKNRNGCAGQQINVNYRPAVHRMY